MAQPMYAVEYLAGMQVESGKVYLSADILTAYPTANMLKMKTDNVSVSIDGTDMFLTKYDDESYIATGKSYIFNKDCLVSIGKYVAIV